MVEVCRICRDTYLRGHLVRQSAQGLLAVQFKLRRVLGSTPSAFVIMLSTQSLSSYPSLEQKPFHSSVRHIENESIFDKQPQEIVDIVLSTLQTAGIQLIEWRHGLYGRMNVPLVLFVRRLDR